MFCNKPIDSTATKMLLYVSEAGDRPEKLGRRFIWVYSTDFFISLAPAWLVENLRKVFRSATVTDEYIAYRALTASRLTLLEFVL